MGTYHGYFGKWAAFTKLTSESLPINPHISAGLQPHCFYLFLCSGQWLMQNVTTASLRLRKRWWREETLELVEDWTKSVPFEPNRTTALMSS